MQRVAQDCSELLVGCRIVAVHSMFEALSRRQLVIVWLVGVWISSVSFWAFLHVRWGLTRVLLAALPALVLGALATRRFAAKGLPGSASAKPIRYRWVGPLLIATIAAVSFGAGLLLSPYMIHRFHSSGIPGTTSPVKDSSDAVASLKGALEEWQCLSEQPEFSRLSPDDQLKRKKKFFREVFSQASIYEAATQSGREELQTWFFWRQISDAAVAKAKVSGGHALALVAQDDWTNPEQRLASDFERAGMPFLVKLHASSSLAQVYDQLAVRHPTLIVILGSSQMRNAALEDLASHDRIWHTDLSRLVYIIEPPSGY